MINPQDARRGVSRNVLVAAVVVVVIVIVAGVYAATLSSSSTTTTSSTSTVSSTTSTTSSSTVTSTTSSSKTSVSTTSSASGLKNLTLEVPTAPTGPNVYALTTDDWVNNLLYDPIFNYNVTSNSAIPIPWLGTSYTSDPTGQYWTITLRQGVTYSDGTQFNATSLMDDLQNLVIVNLFVSPTFDAFMSGGLAYAASNHNAANQSIYKQNDGMKVLSPYVLQINLSKPEADFISYLSGATLGEFGLSPSAVANNGGITVGVGNTWLMTHSAGEGPYVLQSYNPSSSTFVVTANPNWWGISALGLKQPFYKITLNVVVNPATEELDVRSGVANVIPLPVSNIYDFANKTTWSAQGKLVSEVSGTNVFGPILSTSYQMIGFNENIKTSSGTPASSQPFQNMLLREAILEAWNSTSFIQQDLNGFGVASGGIMLQGMLGYQNFPVPYQYNLTESKANLIAACKQLGCSPSNPLGISFICTNDQIAELAGSLLVSTVNSMQTGIVLNFQPLATPAKISAVLSGQFGMAIYEQPSQSPDPLSMLLEFGAVSGTQAHFFGFTNLTITNMISTAAATSNLTTRQALYVQIDKAIAQAANWEQEVQLENVYVTSSNVQIHPFNSALLNVFPPIFAFAPS
ncbi:MAG: hypothetical protein JRN20_10350 [Nitrososphaerota archaeon]|nr:hypothetical protein [Nitrososphaerota archaeon]MDG6923069.1 hypothetical protein [Nitrososphaerota archaeon]